MKSRTGKHRRISKSKESPTLISSALLIIFGFIVATEIKLIQDDSQTTLLFWIILISINVGLFRNLGLHKAIRRNHRFQYWKFKQKSALCLYVLLAITMVGATFNNGDLLFLAFFIALLYIGIRNVRSNFTTLRSIIPKKGTKLGHVSFDIIDQMNGKEFEEFLFKLFDGMGYYAELTPYNDFGIDLITIKDKTKTGIQAKCYGEGRTVGVEAVNEVCGGAGHWKVQRKMVITNRFFTRNALISAKSSSVEMVDREGLQKLIQEYHDLRNKRKVFRLFR